MGIARNIARLVPNGSGLLPNANIEAVAASKLTGSVALATQVSGTLPDANAPSGSVLQVVSTTKTDTFSTTVSDGTFVDITGFSASITPISTSSKIFVMVNIGKASVAVTSRAINFLLVRGSTEIGIANADGSRLRVTFCSHTASFDQNGRGGTSASYSFFDNPSTTSQITYKVQMSGHDGDATVINRSGENLDSNDAPQSRTSSTITLMEIAG